MLIYIYSLGKYPTEFPEVHLTSVQNINIFILKKMLNVIIIQAGIQESNLVVYECNF